MTIEILKTISDSGCNVQHEYSIDRDLKKAKILRYSTGLVIIYIFFLYINFQMHSSQSVNIIEF